MEESSGKPPTSAAEHARFLQGILPAYFADYWAMVAQLGPVSLKTHYDPNRIRSTWDVRDRLGQIDMPTLVISGLYDFVCARRFSDEIVAGIHGVTCLKLHESGHFGYQEQQELLVKTVADFVS